jgi:hypothetical protein
MIDRTAAALHIAHIDARFARSAHRRQHHHAARPLSFGRSTACAAETASRGTDCKIGFLWRPAARERTNNVPQFVLPLDCRGRLTPRQPEQSKSGLELRWPQERSSIGGTTAG